MTEREHIAALAYKFYEDDGRQDGHAAEHWAKAERAVKEQRMPVPEADRMGPDASMLDTSGEVVPH